MRYIIVDAYVDEPACFGVPPFISPYPRYVYGALLDAGINADDILYLTIDSLRKTDYVLQEKASLIIIIGGAVVPGRYLGQKIGTRTEIERIVEINNNKQFALGGPMTAVAQKRKNLTLISNDIEAYAYAHALGKPVDRRRSIPEIDRWAVKGAVVPAFHEQYPTIICEIETYRGCPRIHHCSFCSEGLFTGIETRHQDAIIDEIDALIENGVHRFRLGRQPDILQYKTDFNDFNGGFSRPNPTALKDLFSLLENRRRSGKISTLNVDNANPGTIASFPRESEEILEVIASAVSPGDTLPLGIESFDEKVMIANNLKVTAREAHSVIELINRVGGYKEENLPKLLPGINLIHGLWGESDTTFRINYEQLHDILNKGLLLRRINIRQVTPYPGTAIEKKMPVISTQVRNRFMYYRDKIRHDIDTMMLKKIFPPGLVLSDIIIVDTSNGYSYGRQIASYAITIKFPLEIKSSEPLNAVIISHGERSIIALPIPTNLNLLPNQALAAIPGIGKKGAAEIILKRPLKDYSTVQHILDRVDQAIRLFL